MKLRRSLALLTAGVCFVFAVPAASAGTRVGSSTDGTRVGTAGTRVGSAIVVDNPKRPNLRPAFTPHEKSRGMVPLSLEV